MSGQDRLNNVELLNVPVLKSLRLIAQLPNGTVAAAMQCSKRGAKGGTQPDDNHGVAVIDHCTLFP
jgi:hypothetical protein